MIANVTSARAVPVLIGVGVLARIVFFVGYANVDPWDDTLYLELARAVRFDDSLAVSPPPLAYAPGFAARRGVYYPAAFFQSLLGTGEIAASLYSLLCSIGTLVVTHRLASRLGRPVAVWSIGILALFPLDLAYASRITAEAPQTMWTAVMVWALVAAGERDRALTRGALLVTSALALFVSMSTRLAGVALIPVAAVAALPLVRERARRIDLLWFVGALSVACVASGLWRALALERELQSAIFQSLPRAPIAITSFLTLHVSYTEGGVHQFMKEAFGIVTSYPGVHLFAAYAPLGFVGTLHALRNPRARLFAFWVVWVFVFFQYGFRDLSFDDDVVHYYMVAPRTRHLMLLAPPLAIVSGLLLEDVRRRWPRLAMVLAAVVLVSGLGAATGNHRFLRGSMADVRAAAAYLEARESADRVYSDAWLAHQIPLYGGSTSVLVGEAPAGSLVIVGGSRGFDVRSEDVAPQVSPSSEWEELYRRRAPHHAARRSDLVIYRVP